MLRLCFEIAVAWLAVAGYIFMGGLVHRKYELQAEKERQIQVRVPIARQILHNFAHMRAC